MYQEYRIPAIQMLRQRMNVIARQLFLDNRNLSVPAINSLNEESCILRDNILRIQNNCE